MLAYLVFFAIIFLTRFIRKDTVKCSVLVIAFVLLSSLRSFDIGVDLNGYINKFEAITHTEWNGLFESGYMFSHLEKGYLVYNKLFSYISTDGHVFLFVTSIITYGLLIIALREIDRENYATNAFYYICFSSFFVLLSGIRQALAVSIISIAYVFYTKKKYLIASLLFLLAITFHSTALISLLFVFADKLKLKKRSIFLLIPIWIVVFSLRFTIAQIAFDYISNIFPKVESYSITNTSAYGTLFFYAILLFATFFFSNSENERDSKFIVSRNILFILTLLQVFASTQSNLSRITYYFIPFATYCLSRLSVIQNGKSEYQKIYYTTIPQLGINVALGAFYFYLLFTSDMLNLMPYVFFWE